MLIIISILILLISDRVSDAGSTAPASRYVCDGCTQKSLGGTTCLTLLV